jgi:hypothetical protein
MSNFLRFKRNPLLKLKRVSSGRYIGTATTAIELEGDVKTEQVYVEIRHMPEWRGGWKWGYEVTWNHDDYASKLTEIGDSPTYTKQEAVEALKDALAAGYKFSSSIGWSLR